MNSPSLVWKKSIPDSKIILPDNFFDKIKYIFWRLFTPMHPFVRDSLLTLGVITHVGRQNFRVGYLAPDCKLEDAVKILIDNGYGNHFIAWIDEGEIISMRYVCDFTHQYHIRFFQDGEIRGHYEYTPECYPILHMKDVGMEDRKEKFLAILGNCVVQ